MILGSFFETCETESLVSNQLFLCQSLVPGSIQVKHAKISYNKESCTYRFGDVDFAQLSSLVDYYKNHTFYQRRCLGSPVERRIVLAKVNNVGSPQQEQGADYVEQKFEVLYQYEAERNDELSIKPGDIIRDVHRRSQDWWYGTLEGCNFKRPYGSMGRHGGVRK